ncbi:MAG: hypothetical protein U1E27_06320 [Kiritimatiellia bacterium]|nr:hypothetical protein [Kiritimatiellia bacterium]
MTVSPEKSLPSDPALPSEPVRISLISLWPVVAGVALIFLMGLRPLAHPEIWEHLASGRAIAESGLSKTEPLAFTTADRVDRPATWLYDLAAYRLHRAGGVTALLLAHAALFALGFGCLAAAARKWAPPAAIGTALWMVAGLIAPQLAPGPLAVSVAMFGAFFLFFSRKRPLAAFLALLLLQAFWVRMAPGSIIAPLLTLLAGGIFLFHARQSGSGITQDERRSLWVFGLTALILLGFCLAAPGGLARTGLSRPDRIPALRPFLFWITPATHLFAPSAFRHLATAILVIGALGLIQRKEQLPLFPTVTAIAGALFTVRSIYLLVWFAAVGLPFVSMSLQALADSLFPLSRFPRGGNLRRTATAALAILLLATGVGVVTGHSPRTGMLPKRFGFGTTEDLFSGRAAEFLHSVGALPERTYHLPVDGGAIAWAVPGQKIFVDYRPGVYPDALLPGAAEILVGSPEKRNRVLQTWNLDALLLNCTWPGAARAAGQLLADEQWALAYFDGTTALIVPRRRLGTMAHLLRPIRITGNRILEAEAQTVHASLAAGRRPGYRPRLAGAAAFYRAIGRDAEAVRLYQLLLSACPDLVGARQDYGIALLRSGQPIPAEREFRTALRWTPKDPALWQNLSQSLEMQNRRNAAEEAARNAARYSGLVAPPPKP